MWTSDPRDPAGCFTTVDEAADPVSYLVSDYAEYVTDFISAIDGHSLDRTFLRLAEALSSQ
jgi:hypothetical protein